MDRDRSYLLGIRAVDDALWFARGVALAYVDATRAWIETLYAFTEDIVRPPGRASRGDDRDVNESVWADARTTRRREFVRRDETRRASRVAAAVDRSIAGRSPPADRVDDL